jgi:hypothetical protein
LSKDKLSLENIIRFGPKALAIPVDLARPLLSSAERKRKLPRLFSGPFFGPASVTQFNIHGLIASEDRSRPR